VTSARLDIVRESRLYPWVEVGITYSSPGIDQGTVRLLCTRCRTSGDTLRGFVPVFQLLEELRDFVNQHRDCPPQPPRSTP